MTTPLYTATFRKERSLKFMQELIMSKYLKELLFFLLRNY
ncbi:hypothetical protein HMPREF1705_04677 [Acetomicrobium hydrogeniformans ATCC BAA-1850]|uniref:Uncharacterized protein n=1 Tax=Acetomicrobium hydrogeniformans ATCC BAA-1850 TaxID=592015 RepID=A0A0T5XBM1_9BACT|nr:hypothetical protein HMPREF1705_04677 [Acetomicrobium hydrogeniformans ATCC BAA-1850]